MLGRPTIGLVIASRLPRLMSEQTAGDGETILQFY
jgi:hypothetical protein